MKRFLCAACFAAATLGAYAQTTETGSAETAPAVSDQATSETRPSYARTTASMAMTSGALAARSRNTTAAFEQRWAAEEKIYREAGLSDDKIQKLKVITDEFTQKQTSGERFDYQDMRKRRMEILTEEDMVKLRELGRRRFDRSSTGTQTAPASSAGATTSTAN